MKMDIKQATAILKQAIDLSVSNGAFKTANDVAVVNQALSTLTEYIELREDSKSVEKETQKLPTKK